MTIIQKVRQVRQLTEVGKVGMVGAGRVRGVWPARLCTQGLKGKWSTTGKASIR